MFVLDFRFTNLMLSIFGATCEIFNFVAFKKCNNEWNKQTDEIARTIMLGDAFNSDNEDANAPSENDKTAPTVVVEEE